MIPDFVRGSIAPVFTAFNEDGTLDDDGQRRLLDYLVESEAVYAYFVRCGMGQMYTFSYEDVQQMARTACGHMQGRGPVLVGCSGIWDRNRDRRPDPAEFTRQAVELGHYAAEQGAAGIVYTMPEAIAPGEGETPADVIMRFFETIDGGANVPVFIYQPPGTAEEFHMTVDLARRIADFPNIKGMKLSSASAEIILDITWAVRDKDFGYIVGAETGFYAGLCSGAKAVIGQGATLNPQILNAVQDCFEEENFEAAIDAQRSVNMLVQESVSSVEFFKRYITEKGYPVQPYRRGAGDNPYVKEAPEPLTDTAYARFKKIYEEELAKYC